MPSIGSGSMDTQTEHRAVESSFSATPTIVTATRFEFLLTRLIVRHGLVVHAGMRLERLNSSAHLGGPLVLCGLAGSLVRELTPGTVLIPDNVFTVDGQRFQCDAGLVRTLRAGAIKLGFRPVDGHLLTAPHIVTGAERAVWAKQGFIAADMEAAILAESNTAFATVRVILDSPSRSMSDAWESPAKALMHLDGWRELGWLAWAAPRYSVRAARIAAAAIDQT